jgi:ornithine carbamoyltransferase
MSNAQLQRFADLAGVPVINAMSDDEHPTQAIADISALLARFGTLDGAHLVYVGEGNSTAAALALATSRVRGMRATFVTPVGHGLSSKVIDQAGILGDQFGGQITTTNDLRAVSGADAVYATRWITTGTTKADSNWRRAFEGFSVSSSTFERLAKDPSTVFMHDLPAVRGEDCDAAVIDGPSSIVFDQVSQKLAAATAVLEWCLDERNRMP